MPDKERGEFPLACRVSLQVSFGFPVWSTGLGSGASGALGAISRVSGSMAKSLNKNELFKSRAKALKDAGISNFDLRKNPSNYEKRKARELYNRFNSIIQYPDDYTVKTVKATTARKIDCDKQRVKTKGGMVKLYIPNEGGKKVKINRDKTVTIGDVRDGIQKKIYKGGKDIFKTAEKLLKGVKGEKDGFRTYIMVSIGGNQPFERIFTDLASFQYYMSRWTPKDSEDLDDEEQEEHKDFLFRHMNVIKVKSPEGYFNEGVKTNGTKKKRSKKNRRY